MSKCLSINILLVKINMSILWKYLKIQQKNHKWKIREQICKRKAMGLAISVHGIKLKQRIGNKLKYLKGQTKGVSILLYI